MQERRNRLGRTSIVDAEVDDAGMKAAMFRSTEKRGGAGRGATRSVVEKKECSGERGRGRESESRQQLTCNLTN